MTGLVARLPRWPTLVALAVLVLVAQLPGPHATAWHFFDDAVRLLFGAGPDGEAGGLSLYRDRPDLQFGPLSILAAVPLVALGPTAGAWAAMVVVSVLGLVTWWLVLDTLTTLRPEVGAPEARGTVLVAGVLFVVVWGDLAVRTAHLDDALALAAAAAALRWVARGRGTPAAAAVGVAAAAKPWAVAFLPLVLVGGSGRLGLRVLVAASVPAVTWVPFLLAEPATLATADFVIRNDPTSVLRVLGVNDPVTPAWARPAQLVGGVLVATAVVLRGRWHAVVLAGVAWRLLLEPGAHRYYTAGFVLGALLVELTARPTRVPVATLVAAAVLELTAVPAAPAWSGWLRAGVVATALAVAWWTAPTPNRRGAPDSVGPWLTTRWSGRSGASTAIR